MNVLRLMLELKLVNSTKTASSKPAIYTGQTSGQETDKRQRPVNTGHFTGRKTFTSRSRSYI
jgi:hypothetical protein